MADHKLIKDRKASNWKNKSDIFLIKNQFEIGRASRLIVLEARFDEFEQIANRHVLQLLSIDNWFGNHHGRLSKTALDQNDVKRDILTSGRTINRVNLSKKRSYKKNEPTNFKRTKGAAQRLEHAH